MSAVVKPEFFSHLIIDIRKDKLESAKHQLDRLLAVDSPASFFTKVLEVRALNPAFEHGEGMDPHRGVDDQYKRNCRESEKSSMQSVI